MTMRTRLAILVGRCNRKALGVTVICALVVAVAMAHTQTPASTVAPQAPVVTAPSVVNGTTITGPGDTRGSDGSMDTGTADGAANDSGRTDGTNAQATYAPTVDDLMPPSVSYDEGTGDQRPYIPAFDGE